jgi:hypothetical protein
MHETFCYWSFAQWRQAIEAAGFALHPASHVYSNAWIIDNRLRGKVEFFRQIDGQLEPMPYPVTNMVLVAEKA